MVRLIQLWPIGTRISTSSSGDCRSHRVAARVWRSPRAGRCQCPTIVAGTHRISTPASGRATCTASKGVRAVMSAAGARGSATDERSGALSLSSASKELCSPAACWTIAQPTPSASYRDEWQRLSEPRIYGIRTGVGVERGIHVPSPSSPEELNPQQYAAPLAIRPQV